MKRNLALLALLLIASLCSCQTMTVTLTSSDISVVSIASLFPGVSKSNTKSADMLNQVPQTTYTSSHPGAFISMFDETSVIANPINTANIDWWFFDQPSNTAFFTYSGVVYTATYAPTPQTFSNLLSLTLPALPEMSKCTGLDFAGGYLFVGCLSAATNQAFLYSVKGNVVSGSTTITFTANRNIVNNLRVSINPAASTLFVFDDNWTAASTGNQNAIYVLNVDTFGAFTPNTMIDTIGTSMMTLLNEVTIVAGTPQTAYVSMIDSVSGFFSLYKCTVGADATLALTGCTEQGIAALKVTSGRIKYFSSATSPSVVIFNNSNTSSQTVHHCLADVSGMFTNVSVSMRSLPVTMPAGVRATAITGFNGNQSIYFYNSQTTAMTSIVNIARIPNTSNIQFDSIVEPNQLATLPIAANAALVFFPQYYKTYNQLPEAKYKIYLTSQDFPAPNPAVSDVKLKRALVQIVQTPPTGNPVTKTIRVIVLDAMNSVMGFTDQLPDFGGIAGGSQLSNFDRTWVYGNNLSYQMSSTVLNNPITYNFFGVSYTLLPALTNIRVIKAVDPADIIIDDGANWYYYQCAASNFVSQRSCTQVCQGALPDGFQVMTALATTSYPYQVQAPAIVVGLNNPATSELQVQYIWKANTKLNASFAFPGTYRDLHLINYHGTLMFMVAPLDVANQSNVQAYTTSENITGFGMPTLSFTITPADIGLLNSIVTPIVFKSCAQNDFNFQYLTQFGYIVKINILSDKTFSLRALVRITNINFPSNPIVNFVPEGDEMILVDSAKNVWSTSTQSDNSLYYWNLSEFGFVTVTNFICLRSASSFAVYGTNAAGNLIVGTFFGNQYYSAQSKVHSVVDLGVKSVALKNSVSVKDGVLHLTLTNQGSLIGNMVFMGGLYLQTQFNTTFNDPNLSLTITSGNQTRTKTKQLNVHQMDTSISVSGNNNYSLQVGTYNLDSQATVTGHVAFADLQIPQSVPAGSLQLVQRSTVVNSIAMSAGYIYQYCLSSTPAGNNVVYLSYETASGNLAISITDKNGQSVMNYSLGLPWVIGAAADVQPTYVTVAYLFRWGGTYNFKVIFIPLTGGNPVSYVSGDLNDANARIRLAKIPGGNSYAVYVQSDTANIMTVWRVSNGTGIDATPYDTVAGVINLWKVTSGDAAIVAYNNYRSQVINLHILTSFSATPNYQQITFDGSINEFKRGECISQATQALQCVFSTFGAVAYNVQVFFDNTMTILQDNGIVVRSLSIYAEGGQSGQIDHVSITDKYIALGSIDGSVDIYTTGAAGQGYVYARAFAVSAPKLGASLIHEYLSTPRPFLLVPGANNMYYLVQLNLAGSTNKVIWSTISTLGLVISQSVSTNSATGLYIKLGSMAKPVAFPISAFFTKGGVDPTPVPPVPKDGGHWLLWVLIILFVVAIIGGAVYYKMKKDENKGEGDLYYDGGNFTDKQTDSVKKDKKDSDEFN
jgi:hypothetical protein